MAATGLMSIARNLSLVTTLLVALVACLVGYRRSLYSQTCSLELDQVILLTRKDFPLFFPTQKGGHEQQQQQGEDIPIRIHPCHVFSQDYFEARASFRKAVQGLKDVQQQQRQAQYASQFTTQAEKEGYNNDTLQQKTQIELYTLPVVAEMDYTIDIAVLHGNSNSRKTGGGLVLHSSGVHGVEGYAGSAIQVAFLKSLLAQEKLNARSSLISLSFSSFPTIVLIHAVNPFGMARFRRANENNVDLNRNGIRDWSLIAKNHVNHENYALFDTTLFNILDQPPNGILFLFKAIKAVIQHGIPRIKAAMVAGQYYQPRGIFYGGSGAVEPSIQILQDWLQNVFLAQQPPRQGGEAITWIDVHTGLGKFGHDTLLLKNDLMSKQLAQWFPGSVNTSSQQNSSSTSPSAVHGDDDDDDKNAKDVSQGYDQALGFLAEYLAETVFGPNGDKDNDDDDNNKEKKESNTLVATQEFGTMHNILVGHALMTENSAHDYYDRKQNQPDIALEWAKSTTGRAFYPQNQEWRRQVLTRGLRVLHQAIQRSHQVAAQ